VNIACLAPTAVSGRSKSKKPIDLTSLIGKRVEAKGAVSPESSGKKAETKQAGNQKKHVHGHMKANSIRRIEGACP